MGNPGEYFRLPFIRRPVATYLLTAVVPLGGAVAYSFLPRCPVAPLPEVDFPAIQVQASVPGAGPDTMASSLANRLSVNSAASRS
jgi:multidrug efflux pump subunit AcrB